MTINHTLLSSISSMSSSEFSLLSTAGVIWSRFDSSLCFSPPIETPPGVLTKDDSDPALEEGLVFC